MFTKPQKMAIEHLDGPMLVLAGPGSGKTTVIVNRIRNLVNSGISEDKILVVTFTKAAADEMQKRYENNMRTSMISFGTFHRIFLTIIRRKYNVRIENILSEDYKYNILKNILYRYEKNIFDEKEMIKTFTSEISRVKEERKNPNEFNSEVISYGNFSKAYAEYNSTLRKDKLIDFEDMALLAYDILKGDTKELNYWRNRYKYIMIDEFQDINTIQYEIVKLLLGDNENIFIVGDDDQSIYSFRGANPKLIFKFRDDFSNSKIVILNENFRCSKNIVDIAGTLIKNNTLRYEKEIFTQKSDGIVDITEYNSEKEQAEKIISKIKYYHDNGVDYKNMAILVRSNYNADIIAYNLFNYAIPYNSNIVDMNILEHWVIKDIMLYLKVANGNYGVYDLVKIINKPVRYISTVAIEETKANLNKLKLYYRANISLMSKVECFIQDMKIIKEQVPYMAVKYIFDVVGYKTVINDFCNKNNFDINLIYEILEIFFEICKKCSSYDELIIRISEYKNNMKNINNKSGINLITMHSSKGLEYDVVFVININEGIIPCKQDSFIEEERRLLYVAMTRAKNALHLSYCNKIFGKERENSLFIKELNKRYTIKKY